MLKQNAEIGNVIDSHWWCSRKRCPCMGTTTFIDFLWGRCKAGENMSSLLRSLEALQEGFQVLLWQREGRNRYVGYNTKVGEHRSRAAAQRSYQQQRVSTGKPGAARGCSQLPCWSCCRGWSRAWLSNESCCDSLFCAEAMEGWVTLSELRDAGACQKSSWEALC